MTPNLPKIFLKIDQIVYPFAYCSEAIQIFTTLSPHYPELDYQVLPRDAWY